MFTLEITSKRNDSARTFADLDASKASRMLGKLRQTRCDLALTLYSGGRYLGGEFFAESYRGTNLEKASWLKLHLAILAQG